MKKYETLVLGPIQANCYLLWEDHHVMIVDPGSKNPAVREHIESAKGIVDAIVLTHGHIDHIEGADFWAKEYGCPIYISELDEPLLYDASLNCSAMFKEAFTLKSKVNNIMPGIQKIGAFQFHVYDAPGHSEGSIMLEWGPYLISGDVLFQMSIGRTDLPGGSNSKMTHTLQFIKKLSPELIVLPGHGPATTIQEELLHNPYLY
ncbi:MAG: MBL fold metallo-hydrolase [Erysipelotrichaceae bacterium]|nr:MBL fold metallo-hydrolase [Erysipelotrichaceae bacterium]